MSYGQLINEKILPMPTIRALIKHVPWYGNMGLIDVVKDSREHPCWADDLHASICGSLVVIVVLVNVHPQTLSIPSGDQHCFDTGIDYLIIPTILILLNFMPVYKTLGEFETS
ncbi:hypothetical protein P879_06051 [Paragonimus westermani]|uniref:Uncharacterized protein n=1 Tax=Paragonimus westermani TaxID=34504 RepID=A0A8T0DIL2_9TREM|nr:hypothetical protein P879_06051 [Paragonimus westermani]